MQMVAYPPLVMAAITFFVGLFHLYIFLRRRRPPVHLPFALVCFCIALYDVFCVGLYNSHSTAEGVLWQRLQLDTGFAISIFLIWFVAVFTAQKNKRVMLLLMGWFIVVLVASVFLSPDLTLSPLRPSTQTLVLFGNLPLTYYEGNLGAFFIAAIISTILVYVYFLVLLYRWYRQTREKHSLVIIVALLVYFAGVINDTLVATRVYPFVYVSEYAFMVIVFAMSYVLLNEFVSLYQAVEDANRGLEQKVRERTRKIEEQTRTLIDNQEKIIGARKMEAIARLSAGIAHEFNNIAMAIVGYSEVIILQPAQSIGRYADLIKSAGLRAGRLTGKLLSFSRQQLMNPKATDLNHLVASLEHLLRSMLSEKIGLAVHLNPEPMVAYVDPDLIEEVIRTLLRKAGENVREGGGIVVGTGAVVVPPEPALSSSRPGRYCAITISDTGPLVDKEALSRTFDPFFTEGEFGTGDLDLAAAYGIVAQSEGRIDVRSAPGRGNTFAVLLPEKQCSS